MGVPGLLHWLQKYTNTQTSLIKSYNSKHDNSNNNPRFDNVFIDLNCILHPCTHPEGQLPIENEEKMIERVLRYLDLMFCQLNPRKLMYIAVDGVAPRAKMNHQRSRRFVSSTQNTLEQQIYNELSESIKKVSEENDLDESIYQFSMDKYWDSNLLTPGTTFMEKVSIALHKYVQSKLNTYKHVDIIVDDVSVPGEGEHKIISYLRSQKQSTTYDRNTVHVIHGNDGDLLLLSLALDIPNMWIIKESSKSALPPSMELISMDFLGKLLKQNLIREFRENIEIQKQISEERILNDFIFLCTLCGNDFVPHIPGILVTAEHQCVGLNFLIRAYKTYQIASRKQSSTTDHYFTNGGNMNVKSVLAYLQTISDNLSDISNKVIPHGTESLTLKQIFARRKVENKLHNLVVTKHKLLAMKNQQDIAKAQRQWKHSITQAANCIIMKRICNIAVDSTVQLTTSEGREKYYMIKHDIAQNEVNNLRQSMVRHYLQGLDWVWQYYKDGLKSWSWYYPHHFGPLVSDLCDFSLDLTLHEYEKGAPLKPLSQLACVLPKDSFHAVPGVMRDVVLSQFQDMFPETFLRDIDGHYNKKHSWKAVAILPFIDVVKMNAACTAFEDQLTSEEKRRNTFGDVMVYSYQMLTNEVERMDKKRKRSSSDDTVELQPVEKRARSNSSGMLSSKDYEPAISGVIGN
jgi:5'-3' exonuclease